MHPDDRPALEQYRQDVLSGRELSPLPLRLVKDDGQLIYVENWARPIRASDDSVTGMFGTLQDITERRHIEEALTRANKELIEKQYAIDQAVIVAVTDVKGNITYVNDRFCQISGYSREELLGSNHRIVKSEVHSQAFFRDMYRQIAKGDVWQGELCNKAKDGSLYWVDSTIVPQLGPDGKPVGYMAIRVDITQRKRAEDELRRTQQFLNTVIESVPTPIIVKDVPNSARDARDCRFTFINRACEELFGVPRQQLIGKTTNEIYPKERAEFIVAHDTETLQSDQPVLIRDHPVVTPGNGTRLVTSKKVVIRKDDGNPHYLLTVLEDVTERRNVEGQLRQAQKMEAIGNLTGGVAHDFNNLLTIMIGNLDMLQEEIGKVPWATQKVEAVLDAALRGAELTKQMLVFSRRQPLQSECVDANSLADRTAQLLARTLGEGIRIDVCKSPDTCQIMVDESQLEAALINLAINARDAMPNGGVLTVTTDRVLFSEVDAAHRPGLAAGEYVVIKISDSGTGIPEEILSHIFEPFFTTKETGKGTGLGLSMVYGFVKQSGGYIGVTSTPGAGTAFELCFPAIAATALSADASAPNMDSEISRPACCVVLAVDDQPEVRATAVAHLTALGYQVLEADCAQAALDKLAAGVKIDLLFTDIVMPGGLNGVELARLARVERPGLKVLYTSGYPGTGHGARIEVSVDGALLAKPYRKQELAKAVAEVLAAA